MIAKRLIGIIVVGAVVLLAGCSGDKAKMLQQLELLEQQNRSGEAMLNDSLAESLVNYFDRHGDANERMRSRYLLGRTYYCLGELPRALEMYNEAADCADTTSADCNYKVLSRIHAQSAVIFDLQVQPRSQLQQLRLAEHYAWRGKDTLQAIECYAQQGDVYAFLTIPDSAILIKEDASRLYKDVGRQDWAAMTLGSVIRQLIKKGDIERARLYCCLYELKSGLFDEDGNIERGREIFYSIKGEYYLATQQLDSAENMYRKELQYGQDLNNKIAGCKGLQNVYEQRKMSDSIAKYASLAYEFNDSAYSTSEMQNIQKFQASYNYNHQKQLAEDKANDARNAYIAIGIIIAMIVFVTVIVWLWFRHHRIEQQLKEVQYQQTQNLLEQAQSDLMEMQEKNENASDLINRKSKEISDLQAQIVQYQHRQNIKEHANLEDILDNATIIRELTDLLKANPIQSATQGQLRELRKLINEQIPIFYDTINSKSPLRPIEYEVCLLVRCHFKPSSIGKLLGLDEAYVSNVRRRILHKVYGIEGNPKDLDERIMAIV
jgi:tetratricopeptide (TPR) repeat protein